MKTVFFLNIVIIIEEILLFYLLNSCAAMEFVVDKCLYNFYQIARFCGLVSCSPNILSKSLNCYYVILNLGFYGLGAG